QFPSDANAGLGRIAFPIDFVGRLSHVRLDLRGSDLLLGSERFGATRRGHDEEQRRARRRSAATLTSNLMALANRVMAFRTRWFLESAAILALAACSDTTRPGSSVFSLHAATTNLHLYEQTTVTAVAVPGLVTWTVSDAAVLEILSVAGD